MSTVTTQRMPEAAHTDSSEVPPGYKRTGVGIIPEDWEPKRLGEIGTTYGGLTGKTKADFGTGEARYVTFLNVLENVVLDPNEFDAVCVSKGESQNPVRKGDLLFNGTSETPGDLALGSVAQVAEENLFLNSFCFGYRIYEQDLHSPLFLAYYFRGSPGRRLMYALAQGATRYNMSKKQFLALWLSLPQTEEQSTIAEALSDVDRLLGALETLIAKKRAIKQATMQQLLTSKTRLPGFSGPWETKRLGEIATIENGATPSTRVAKYWDGTISWCTPTDITSRPGKYLKNTARRITEAGLASCAANLLPVGTLLLCSRATIGEVKIAQTEICTNQGFKSLVCKEGVSNEFLYYLLLTLKPKMVERASGSTFLEIGKHDISWISARIPGEDEQTAIAGVLSDMDAEIAALERRRDKTRAIKQGMMQQLLTGRVRLVKPDTQTPEVRAEADGKATKPRSWAFNEAVVISALASLFGTEQYPLGRMRRTKLSYLLHRHSEKQTEGYLKKAAGPYNPKTRYGGPERLAVEKGYVREHKNGSYRGFVAGDNIAQAEAYFEKWYGARMIRWLEQFRMKTNDELELVATVDVAAEELRASGDNVDVATVKGVIGSHPEWEAKLDRAIFSDAKIAEALQQSERLFGSSVERSA